MSIEDSATPPWLAPFRDEAILLDVQRIIRSGKEATVYLCRAHPSQRHRFVAAKVYRDRKTRGFKDDSIYQEGQKVFRMEGAGRIVRAMNRKTAVGEAARAALWAEREYEVLESLYDAGFAVPEPLAVDGVTVAMELVGEGDEPAPQLREAVLDAHEAQAVLDRLIEEIRGWLRLNVVHGDLSAYNVLYHRGGPVVIDFPQAVDPRFNSHARALLERDIANVAAFCVRFGAVCDVAAIADEAWLAFERGG